MNTAKQKHMTFDDIWVNFSKFLTITFCILISLGTFEIRCHENSVVHTFEIHYSYLPFRKKWPTKVNYHQIFCLLAYVDCISLRLIYCYVSNMADSSTVDCLVFWLAVLSHSSLLLLWSGYDVNTDTQRNSGKWPQRWTIRWLCFDCPVNVLA